MSWPGVGKETEGAVEHTAGEQDPKTQVEVQQQ
jgi:hypothetical protein